VYAEGFRKAGMAEGQSHPGEPNIGLINC